MAGTTVAGLSQSLLKQVNYFLKFEVKLCFTVLDAHIQGFAVSEGVGFHCQEVIGFFLLCSAGASKQQTHVTRVLSGVSKNSTDVVITMDVFSAKLSHH